MPKLIPPRGTLRREIGLLLLGFIIIPCLLFAILMGALILSTFIPPSYQDIRKGFSPRLTDHLPLTLPSHPDAVKMDRRSFTGPLPAPDPYFSLKVKYHAQSDFDAELARLRALTVSPDPTTNETEDRWNQVRSFASQLVIEPAKLGPRAEFLVFQPVDGMDQIHAQDLAFSIADPDTRTIWYTMQNL